MRCSRVFRSKANRDSSRDLARRWHPLNAEDGFTLVELLVVLGIVALLATLVGPRVLGYFAKAKSQTAQIQIRNLHNAVELYFLDTGNYPDSETGLDALMASPADTPGWGGPYLKIKENLVDPWGHPYAYKFPGEHGAFDLVSFGRDAQPGGEGEDRDLINW
jgi:general secretion pathway protein G